MDDLPLLTALVLVPAIGAVAVALVPKRRDDTARIVGFVFSLAVAAVSLAVLVAFDGDDGGFQLVSEHAWIRSFGISWKLGVDGISLFLVLLSALLFPLAIVGPRVHDDVRGYTAWMLLLEAGCIGVFLSLDLFLFFLFWEVVLVPMYFLIGGWGYERRVYATLKFFLYTMVGSALMLVGILTVAFLHEQNTGRLTFDLVALAREQSIAAARMSDAAVAASTWASGSQVWSGKSWTLTAKAMKKAEKT